MKIWPLVLLFFSSALCAQWDGDYSLIAEKEGCPEGALILSKDRVLFGSRLNFELKPAESKGQEGECFYSVKTTLEKDKDVLTISRKTERSKCKTVKFNGTSAEVLTAEKGSATYSITSLDAEGKKQEELVCQYKKD